MNIEQVGELSRSRATVTAVIPTMNEARNVAHVLDRLPGIVSEVVIVDGHSADDTVAAARAARPDIRTVLQGGYGKGNALACGFAAARGDIIVMLDADGSTDPREIPAFVRPLLAGADLVKGSRFARGGWSEDITRLRATGNRMLVAVVNRLFHTAYTDLCYGYAAFWRHTVPRLRIDCNGFEVETLIAIRAAQENLRVVEVPSIERSRLHGEGKLRTFHDGRRVLGTIVRERLRTAPRPAAVPRYAEVRRPVAEPVRRAQPPTGFSTAMRSAGLAGAVAAPALVAFGAASAARMLAVLLLFAIAPGAALLSRSPNDSGASEPALVIALSLAVLVVTSQLLLLADAWNTELAVYGLAAACAPPLAAALTRPRRCLRGA